MDWIECEEAAAIILYNDVVSNSHQSNTTREKEEDHQPNEITLIEFHWTLTKKKDFGCRKVVVNCSSSVVDGWSDVVNAWKSCE